MRKPEIEAVKHKGKRVVVTAGKKGFPLAAVEVIVSDTNGAINATYAATFVSWNEWEVRLPFSLPTPDTGQKITVAARDHAGNMDIINMT